VDAIKTRIAELEQVEAALTDLFTRATDGEEGAAAVPIR